MITSVDESSNSLLIKEVLNRETGELLPASNILTQDERTIFLLRTRLERSILEEHKYLVCPYCGQYLKLRSGYGKKYRIHFAHLKDSDECPIKTNTSLSKEEILALKYNGCKESDRHFELKNKLYEILIIDTRFKNTKLETVIKDISEKKRWKKPDIQSCYRETKVVFEIQLSTTFLSVIVSRDILYKDNSIPLIWIFDNYNLEDSRFADRDIFYNNNSNAFIFDDECYQVSLKKKLLFLKVVYKTISFEDGKIVELNKIDIIDFKEITFCDNVAYYYNYEKEKKRTDYFVLKRTFNDFLLEFKNERVDHLMFLNYLKEFEKYNMAKWNDSKDIALIEDLICVFISIKNGIVIGFKYSKIIQLVNHIYDHRIEGFGLLLKFINDGNFESNIIATDKNGTYKRLKDSFLKKQIKYQQRHIEYLHYLFPEIKYTKIENHP